MTSWGESAGTCWEMAATHKDFSAVLLCNPALQYPLEISHTVRNITTPSSETRVAQVPPTLSSA